MTTVFYSIYTIDSSMNMYANYGKTFKKPRRPYEKERLDAECKRELWRVQYALSRIRNVARNILTLDEKDPRRIFEGENKLDYVLALTVENFLEHRLQTLVFKSRMAKSIHHARVLIRQRHIRTCMDIILVFLVNNVNLKVVDLRSFLIYQVGMIMYLMTSDACQRKEITWVQFSSELRVCLSSTD
ncbi:hypothetical protein MKW98_026403 [Papaver atlanticum]|uniref:Small ribosomal subunit protein uS4 N-terminal domain-containing protein n=1 Tax=Papaver atlanticum TaxID=357466 RepID=A0AAD4SP20_9MAGN|nr:hypothetical protein MKW98_026403 [Papaver atlanticum]